MVWCYEVRKGGKGEYMKDVRDERRNEEQGGIVKPASNDGTTSQNEKKYTACKHKEGRNTGYGNKVEKGRWAWDHSIVYEKHKQGRQDNQG
jgi:hypothetical protein